MVGAYDSSCAGNRGTRDLGMAAEETVDDEHNSGS